MHHSVLFERRRPVDAELMERYQRFNRELFDNQLPTIPIYWDTLRKMGGKVFFQWQRKPGVPAPNPMMIRLGRATKYDGGEPIMSTMYMVLSDLFQRDEAGLNGILVHEMIHVYVAAVLKDVGDSHGPKFTATMKRLQSKVDFTIPLRDDVDGLAVSDHVKVKPLYVVWATYRSKPANKPVWHLLPSRYGTDAALQQQVHNALEHQMETEFLEDVKIVKVQSPEWLRVSLEMKTIPRTYKPAYYNRRALQQYHPDAHRQADEAPAVWQAIRG